jgi:sarcosine oxidase
VSVDVAIVGAGVVGAATAHALVREGAEVVVYEQFRLGHERGASHGRSRIFRLAYADPAWVALAAEALRGWRALEAEAGEPLLELSGLLELVERLEDSSAATLSACGVPWEELGPAEVARRFPLCLPPGQRAVLQPEAGIVNADRALRAFMRGVRVEEGQRIRSLDELDSRVVVVTAGAWARPLLADAGIDLPVRVTRETVAYFQLEDERPVPAVVDFKPNTQGHDVYALADPLHGLKVGVHFGGPAADPDGEGLPEPVLVERMSSWVAERFPGASPEPVALDTCLYTATVDESFVLERHGRVIVGSACSGHGFKFAPAVGSRLAGLALEALG